MNFQTYTRVVVGALENYMEQHSSAGIDCIKSWNSWDWLEDVYRPMYDAYLDILNASNPADLILAVEWASHLNHASGSLMHDYCYVPNAEDVLDRLEQKGLEKTFPKWEKQARKTIRRLNRNFDIPSPETIEGWIYPKCVYCGSDDIPTDQEGEAMSLTCSECQEKLDENGPCVACEHGIGLYGELCLDCILEYSEVLIYSVG